MEKNKKKINKVNQERIPPLFQISFENEAKIITAVLALEKILKDKINQFLKEYCETDDWRHSDIFQSQEHLKEAIHYLEKGNKKLKTQDFIESVSFKFWYLVIKTESDFQKKLFGFLFSGNKIEPSDFEDMLKKTIDHRNNLMHSKNPRSYPLNEKLDNHYRVLKLIKLLDSREEKKYAFLFSEQKKETSILEKALKKNSDLENQNSLRQIATLTNGKEKFSTDLYREITQLENSFQLYSQGISVFYNPLNSMLQLSLIQSSDDDVLRKKALLIGDVHSSQPLMVTFLVKMNQDRKISKYFKNLLLMLDDLKVSKNIKMIKSIFLSFIELYEFTSASHFKKKVFNKAKEFIENKILNEIQSLKRNVKYKVYLDELIALSISILLLYSSKINTENSIWNKLKWYFTTKDSSQLFEPLGIPAIIFKAIENFVFPAWLNLSTRYQVDIAYWISQVLLPLKYSSQNLGFSLLSPLIHSCDTFNKFFLSMLESGNLSSYFEILAEILDAFDPEKWIMQKMLEKFDSYPREIQSQIMRILIYTKEAAKSFSLREHIYGKIQELHMNDFYYIDALIFLYKKIDDLECKKKLIKEMQDLKDQKSMGSIKFLELLFENNIDLPIESELLVFNLLNLPPLDKRDDFLLNYLVCKQDMMLVSYLKDLIFKQKIDAKIGEPGDLLFENHYLFMVDLCVRLQDPFLVKEFIDFFLKKSKDEAVPNYKVKFFMNILLLILDKTPNLEVATYISKELKASQNLLDSLEGYYDKMSRHQLIIELIRNFFLSKELIFIEEIYLLELSRQVLLNKNNFLDEKTIVRAIDIILNDFERIKSDLAQDNNVYDFTGLSERFLNNLNALVQVDKNTYPIDWKKLNLSIEWALKTFKKLEDLFFEYHLLYVAGSIQDKDMLKIIVQHLLVSGYSDAVIKNGKEYFYGIKFYNNISRERYDTRGSFFNSTNSVSTQNNRLTPNMENVRVLAN